MRISHWLRPLATRLSRVPTPQTKRRRTFRPRVEILEDRTAPAVFTVTNTDDNGGVNPAAFAGTGTLRQAIIDANATPGADTIQFAIPDSMKTAGHNWWTIAPTSQLPDITDTVLIDGWSQGGTGYRGSPEIMIDGTNAAGAYGGITVSDPTFPDGVVIRGLAIGNYAVGIVVNQAINTTIQGCYLGLDPSGTTIAPNQYGFSEFGDAYGTTIGGTNPGEGNVISGNSDRNIGTPTGDSVTIRGNFIGTDASGTVALSNSTTVGIDLGYIAQDDSASIIADNLISGNGGDGILVGATNHVRIFGNLIGTDVTGTKALGNGQYGIGVRGGSDTVIGGSDAGSRNVISANGHSGIAGADGSQAIVQGNYIGTDVNGAPTLGNGFGIGAAANWLIGGTAVGAGNLIAGNGQASGGGGILVESSNDLIQGNVIRENYGAGVYIQAWVPPAWGNTVSQNAIYGNFPGPYDPGLGRNDGEGLGIDILAHFSDPAGVTLNDSMGHDGPNHVQNFPVLTGLTPTASGVTVTGSLTQSVTPNTVFRIEFFANHEADPSGYGEGERYIGSIDVTTDANGIASFTAPVGALLAGEEYLTTTATNLATGDTSEFSKAMGAAVATLTSSATPSLVGQPVTFTATLSASAGSDTPSGSVDFVDTTTNTDLGTVALSGGTASLTTSSLAVGTHVIEAIYGGDGNFLATNASITQTVTAAPTVAVTASAATPLLGDSVTFTATVTAATGTPTGSVDFFDSTTGTDLGSVALVNGTATLSTSALTVDSHTIVATYSGDSQFASSQGSTTLTVLAPASLSGLVFEDFNDNGLVDFGEQGIAGVTITLSGTDDLGDSVNQTQVTDGDGAYVFLNLRPGTYYLTETQPAGYTQGIDTIGTAGGSLSATDQFSVTLGQGINGLNYNFGEQPQASGGVQKGQTAGIGFWNNKNGQALIQSFNGGPASTQLAAWLAATLPHTFGVDAGSNAFIHADGSYFTNAEVAARFQQDFVLKGVKLDAQLLATALSVYATNATLDDTGVATNYGFLVSGDGVGTASVNVGSDGDAFGVANNTVLTVLDLLKATDALAVDGLLYNGDAVKRKEANSVYGAINDAGNIG